MLSFTPWSPQRKKLVGSIILAKFLELPLRKYEEFINKTERSKLFRQLLQEGYLSFDEFTACPESAGGGRGACAERSTSEQSRTSRGRGSIFDRSVELPPDCLAAIERVKKGHTILYKHPRFNGIYHLLGESNEKGKFKVIKLMRDLRKISTRNQLTYAILSAILNHQEKYIESGNSLHLKPLTGQMIKEMTKEKCCLMNNCVISRLIKNKAIMLPWRDIISLKDLIPSKKKIYKKYIKNIVQEEYPMNNFKQPLNDHIIKKMLKRRYGIFASRRSVCQARKELGISSRERRRKKPYCQLALKIFSTFYPLERKAIDRYASESPGVYELCINRNELAYPKRKSGKFYIGSAKNIKKRLMTHLNPNHKNANIAGHLKNHGCIFRFAGIARSWRKTEKQLYDLFVETYGASPIGNKLSP